MSGQPKAAEHRLRDAEQWLDTQAEAGMVGVLADKMVVANLDEFRTLPAKIAIARAARAQALGDVHGLTEHARQALELLPEDHYFERGAAAGLLGLAYWARGNLEAAHWTFSESQASLQAAGNLSDAISGNLILGDIRTAQGDFPLALNLLERALTEAEPEGYVRVFVNEGAPMAALQGSLLAVHRLHHLCDHSDLGLHTRADHQPFAAPVTDHRTHKGSIFLVSERDILAQMNRAVFVRRDGFACQRRFIDAQVDRLEQANIGGQVVACFEQYQPGTN